MKINTILWVGGLSFVFSCSSFAQSADVKPHLPGDPKVTVRAWQESIDDLRKGAEVLLKENEELTSENSKLFSNLADLQKSVEETRAENTRLIGEPARLNKLIEESGIKKKSSEKEIRELENKASRLNKENAALQQRLSRLEERQKPFEAQIADLNAERVELTVNLKLGEAAPTQELEKLKAEIQGIKDLLLENQKKETETHKAIVEASGPFSLPAKGVIRLKEENQALQKELSKTKNTQKASGNEIAIWQKKNSEIGKSNEDAVTKKAAQKEELENKIRQLEIQVAQARKFIENPVAAAVDTDETSLHETINNLEQEKQGFENRIFDLAQAILVVKRDNTMMEALLNVQGQAQGESAESSLRADAETGGVLEAMGYAFASQGMYEESVKKYKKALEQGADKKNIYFNLGYIYFKMGDMKEAMRNYRRALKIDPQDYEARRNLTELRERLSR